MKSLALLMTFVSNVFASSAITSYKYFQLRERTKMRECLCREFPLEIRDKFHHAVIKDVVKRFSSVKKSKEIGLTIVSYASGKLLREYLIVKHLHQLGFENIHLIAIDTAYSYLKRDKGIQSAIDDFRKKTEKYAFLSAFQRTQGYLDEIEEDPSLRGHILLDIDSNTFKDKTDYNHLLTSGLKKDGVSYALRLESGAEIRIHTASLIFPNQLKTSLPGFSELTKDERVVKECDFLFPFSIRSLIMDYIR